ncbi:Hypp8244 [Branchiostoma lanceolatum]|uniref:Hypp8244 protein n=1 Tax=Branchiostoma lanceolatum TaxID=7740 RepID=A0A8K0ED53_BRALA|nr:Hypp8244 [Branchiostoma lanceolatum]
MAACSILGKTKPEDLQKFRLADFSRELEANAPWLDNCLCGACLESETIQKESISLLNFLREVVIEENRVQYKTGLETSGSSTISSADLQAQKFAFESYDGCAPLSLETEDDVDFDLLGSGENPNKSVHWVHQYAVVDRALTNLPSDQPQKLLRDVSVEDLLPIYDVQQSVRWNYTIIIARLLVTYMGRFKGFRKDAVWNIPHEFSAEMEKNLSSLNRDMSQILHKIQEEFVPAEVDEDGCITKLAHPILLIYYDKYFIPTSGADKASMCANMNVIWATNAKEGPHVAYNPFMEFFKKDFHASVVHAAMKTFHHQSIDGHTFCKACLLRWLGGGHDGCPECRQSMNVNDLVMGRVIDEFLDHGASTSVFWREIECARGKGLMTAWVTMIRIGMESHRRICKEALLDCGDCGNAVKRAGIRAHLEHMCPEGTAQCALLCGREVTG